MPTNDASIKLQEELKNAFGVFNEFAENLSSSYRDLEERVRELNNELVSARSERLVQLAEKERIACRLENLLKALPAGVVVLDGRGIVQESNPAAEEFLDIPLVGELWRNIIERAFKSGTSTGSEAQLKDNRLISISTCPRGDEPGQIILLVDVTETRSMQNSLERYKRLSAMGEMTAKLAHQIRTPLSSALLYVSHLSKSQLSSSDRIRFSEKALSRLHHLEAVVEDMLAYTRGGGANHVSVNLVDIIDELQHSMEPQLESACCRLYVQDNTDDVFLRANKDALLGVLQNIITNAIQACEDDGILWIKTRPVTEHKGIPAIDLVVRDNGPGIAPEHRERIFEPFFTTRSQGTGLGLAVARAVVQAHGGSIWIESTGSQGTTFVIRLPIDLAAVRQMASEEMTTDDGQQSLQRSAV